MDATAVKRYLNELHDRITAAVEAVDGLKFRRDPWVRAEGGGGESRILSGGAVFERAGVSVSHVFGEKMPASASNARA
jgi:coproporphyrinogen III oxidase